MNSSSRTNSLPPLFFFAIVALAVQREALNKRQLVLQIEFPFRGFGHKFTYYYYAVVAITERL